MTYFSYPLKLLITLACIFSSHLAFTENSSSVQEKYIAAQRELLLRNKAIKESYTFEVLGKQFIGLPNVFSPKVCCENGFFVERIPISQGDEVLELGAGTGFFPVFAVLKGAAKVIATDINPDAVSNIILNSQLHQMEGQIQALQSNIFDRLSENVKFDVIYWNIPFTPTKAVGLTLTDLFVFDPEGSFLDSYLKEGDKFLKPNGSLYLGYSSTHGDVAMMKELAKKYHWDVIQRATAGNTETIIVELFEFKKSYIENSLQEK